MTRGHLPQVRCIPVLIDGSLSGPGSEFCLMTGVCVCFGDPGRRALSRFVWSGLVGSSCFHVSEGIVDLESSSGWGQHRQNQEGPTGVWKQDSVLHRSELAHGFLCTSASKVRSGRGGKGARHPGGWGFGAAGRGRLAQTAYAMRPPFPQSGTKRGGTSSRMAGFFPVIESRCGPTSLALRAAASVAECYQGCALDAQGN